MSASDAKKADRVKFEAVFEKIRDELVDHFANNGMPSEAIEWYRSVRPPILSQQLLTVCSRILTTMFRAVNLTAECLSSIPLRSSKDEN
jgi:hypothetical protein